jgi:hypothetical protein
MQALRRKVSGESGASNVEQWYESLSGSR